MYSKTVKDLSVKVEYAKLANGTVSVNYTIPESMKAGDYTIAAIYMPTSRDRVDSNAVLAVI